MSRILIFTTTLSLIFFSTATETNADFFVSGLDDQSTFRFGSNETQVTANDFFTWSSNLFLFSPPGITDAPRISSFTNDGDFVSGDLGGGTNGVFGELETPFQITSAAGNSTVIGIVFDDDGSTDDLHVLLAQDAPTPSLDFTIPEFETNITFQQGTFGDLIPGTYTLADGFPGVNLQIAVVPEPSTATLLGSLALVLLNRQRQKRTAK